MTSKLSIALLALFMALMGIGQLLLLPPFEGFDEKGHFSLIAQTAHEGRFPFDGMAYLDQRITDYQKEAPMPYAVLEPYEQNGGLTYPSFFAIKQLAQNYNAHFRTSGGIGTYRPSPELNWQAQHPPLYYMVMAPLMRLVGSWSMGDQFLILRLASYFLAMMGLFLGLFGSLRYIQFDLRPYVLLATVLYPLILPQIIPEFARIGNDSLCLFLMGLLWFLLMRELHKGPSVKNTAAIGFVWGAGLLTKGLFIPPLLGWGAFSLYRLWRERAEPLMIKRRLLHLSMTALPIMFGVSWYLYKYLMTGALIGHLEYKLAIEHGGILSQMGSTLTATSLVNSLFNLLLTWSWAGIASLVRFHELLLIPLAAIPVWLITRSAIAARSKSLTDAYALALFLIVPMLLGILHHCLVVLLVDPKGGTPGWYFHILAAPVAVLFAHGLSSLFPSRVPRLLLFVLVVYAFLFYALALWANIALTGGCAGFDSSKIFSFPDAALCLSQAQSIIDNIGILAWPRTALAFIAAAFIAWGGALWLSWRQIPHKHKEFAPSP